MIAVESLGARKGQFELRDVTFAVPTGGWGVVIGPAGSGKTTLLEAIAGTAHRTAGRVLLGARGGEERDVTRLPPEERRVGFVYQHGYLFPHLDAWGNVRYGAPSDAAARDAAGRTGADRLLARDPRTLSGGERQLVAIARALARRPDVLLLDEPFGALDPRRRDLVRRSVREAPREGGLTVLQVTHDFAEAGLLGDVAVVLDGGRMLQHGEPSAVFRRPSSPYIAEFLGAENVFEGRATASGDRVPAGEADAGALRLYEFEAMGLRLQGVGSVQEGRCHAVIRGEDITLSLEPHPSSARNVLGGRVLELVPAGVLTRVLVDVAGTTLVATLTARSARDMALVAGTHVWAGVKASAVHLC